MYVFWNSVKLRIIFLFCLYLQFGYNVSAQCPSVEAMMVDACGVEALNEFVIFNSGGGFNTSDIVVDFAPGNNSTSVLNNDINTDVDNFPPGTPCGLTVGNPDAYTGCSNIIAIGPGFSVPANQIVVLQLSAGSTNNLYDFSSLCGSGQCVYVISNSCMRAGNVGALTNSGSGTRTTNFEFGSGCLQTVIHIPSSIVGGNGAYYLPPTDTYGNNGCVVPPTSPAPMPQVPTFNNFGPYCVGQTPGVLPTTSNNGISGTWNPATINTSTAGPSDYIFTPNAGQCAEPFTLNVVVNPNIVPSFDPIPNLCQFSTPPILPTTSNNGISGMWSPVNISTSLQGTFTYVFSPTAGQCAEVITIEITILPSISPTFDPIPALCQNSTPPSLQTTSNNGIIGTWNPTTINTSIANTTTYTFTPNAGQCAQVVTVDITILPNVTPTFTAIPNICQNSVAPTLPMTSNNGVMGTWNPSVINTANLGTTTYTFTPNVGQCASVVTIDVTITPEVTPTFSPIGNLCQGATPPNLPTTSNNGISGTWNPSTINTSIVGPTNYTFTPNPGQCATELVITITVLEIPFGYLDGIVDLCPGECGEIIFRLSGGTGLYNVQMSVTVGPFTIPFPMPAITNNTVLTICYTGSGIFPQFQAPSTVLIPTSAPPGSITFNMLSIMDDSGGPCANGTIGANQSSVTLRAKPNAVDASMTVCDEDNDGSGIFDLTSLNNVVNGNNPSFGVEWFRDMALTDFISNPSSFSATNGTVVYAEVTNSFGCTDIAEVTLTVDPPSNPVLSTFTVCLTDPPLVLPLNQNGVTGTWSDVNGHVSGNQFNPSGLAEGDYTIIFTPDPGQCYIPGTTTVTVTSGGPVPLPNPIAVVCIGEGIYILPDMPSGVVGTWSSVNPNLSGNVFNLVGSGVGVFLLTFTPTSGNSCFLPNNTNIHVIPNANLTPPDFPEVCANSGLFNLGNNVNGLSGTWGGDPNVVNNMFNTNTLPGDYIITFTPVDICTNPLDITLVITAQNNINPPTFGTLCTSSPPIILPNVVDGIPGTWLINGTLITQFDPNVYGTGVFDLDFIPDSDQCSNEFTVQIEVGSVTAGFDFLVQMCISNPDTINLNDYLSASASSGGAWILDGNIVNNPEAYVVSALMDGQFEFLYILDDPQCGSDTAIITIEKQSLKIAGNDGDLLGCVNMLSNVDFAQILGSYDAGGVWNNDKNIVFDFSDPTNVDLSALSIGMTEFSYTFDGGICPSDTANILVSVAESFSAGPDVTGDICINSMVNLDQIIITNYTSGIFEDFQNYGGLTGSVWDATGFNEGDYMFRYITPINGVCMGDTSTIFIKIASSLDAGPDQIIEYCDGLGFVPSDFLPSDASPGGRIIFEGNVIPVGMLFTGNLPVYNLMYVVGDGILCPADTAFWTFLRIDKPTITYTYSASGILEFCEGSCVDLTITHNSTEVLEVMWDNLGRTHRATIFPGVPLVFTFCSDNTLPYDFFNLRPGDINLLALITIFMGDCEFSNSPSLGLFINVKQAPITNINQTLCAGETLQIGSDIYSIINPSGTTIIPSADIAVCDSIFNVDLTFISSSDITNINETTCNQDFVLQVGTVTFDINNQSGEVTLKNSFGCDSIVRVNIEFLDAVETEIMETTCDKSFSMNVGNTIFNFNNPNGEIALTTQNGCDSIVKVNLTFIEGGENTIVQSTCNEDFSLMVGGINFDINNPSGQVIIPNVAFNGCDSIINVNLTFNVFSFDFNLTQPECGSDLGTLNLSNSNYTGPFSLILNGIPNQTIPSLPFQIDLTAGMFEVTLETSELCRSSVDVDVIENLIPTISVAVILLSESDSQIEMNGDLDFIFDIEWQPSEGLSCTDCPNPIASPRETTLYTVTYNYGLNCTDTKSILIERQPVGEVIIPNIFMPESTNGNGYFYITFPKGLEGKILQMNIYDRWGELVFQNKNVEPNTPENGWDGRLSGKGVVPGVYVYYLELEVLGEDRLMQKYGNITVIR